MHAFFHAVSVFWDHLAAVKWQFLALALGCHFAKLVFRVVAWREILKAAFPKTRIGFFSTFGAYAAGVGVNSVVPARGGDLVKIFLLRRRCPDLEVATLAPTLVAETLLDFFVAGGMMIWAFSIGVLPTHQVYSRLPTVDWRFLLRHDKATAIGIAIVLAAAAIAFVIFLEKGEAFRARIGRGFAILRDPWRFARGVALPQGISWVLRIASLYYFLKAFGVDATIHNALLAQVVDSLATLFPATPGGAGTKQGLIVFLFRGQTVSTSLLLAFSVGMNIAIVVFNLALGGLCILIMARTLSWRGLRATAEETS